MAAAVAAAIGGETPRQARINLPQSAASSTLRRPIIVPSSFSPLRTATAGDQLRRCSVTATTPSVARSTQSHPPSGEQRSQLQRQPLQFKKRPTRSSNASQSPSLQPISKPFFWKSSTSLSGGRVSAAATSGDSSGSGSTGNRTPITAHRRTALAAATAAPATANNQEQQAARRGRQLASSTLSSRRSCDIIPLATNKQSFSARTTPSAATSNSRLRQGLLYARRQAHLMPSAAGSIEATLIARPAPHSTSHQRHQLASTLHKQRLRRGASLLTVALHNKRQQQANRASTIIESDNRIRQAIAASHQMTASCQALNGANCLPKQRQSGKLTSSTSSLTVAVVKRPRQNLLAGALQQQQHHQTQQPNKGRRWSAGIESVSSSSSTCSSSRSSATSSSSLCSANLTSINCGQTRATGESKTGVLECGDDHWRRVGVQAEAEGSGADAPTCTRTPKQKQKQQQQQQRRRITTGGENGQIDKQKQANIILDHQRNYDKENLIRDPIGKVSCATSATAKIVRNNNTIVTISCHHIGTESNNTNVDCSTCTTPSLADNIKNDSDNHVSSSCQRQLENNHCRESPISVDFTSEDSNSHDHNDSDGQKEGELMVLSLESATVDHLEINKSNEKHSTPSQCLRQQNQQQQQQRILDRPAPLGCTQLEVGTCSRGSQGQQSMVSPIGDQDIENSSINIVAEDDAGAAAGSNEVKMMISNESQNSNNSGNNNNIELRREGKMLDNNNQAKPLGLHQSININGTLKNISHVVDHCSTEIVDSLKSPRLPLTPANATNTSCSHDSPTTPEATSKEPVAEIPIKLEPISNSYDLETRPFARGKFAQVKRCTPKSNTSLCFAAKCIKKRRRQTDIRHEILLEIEALKLSYQTKHIVKLYEVYETPSEMILVLEMAQGGELQRVLDDEEQLEEHMVRRFTRQILDGLIFLHDNQIAHLDIKPQNLLLTEPFPNGHIKLCDFGISRRITEGCEIRDICGTPDYVAPEILRYDPISLATDMWSLGVLTYVLLSGYSPFGSENKQQTFCNITQGALDFPAEIFGKISQDAIDFIRKLIVREPSARLTSRQARKHHWLS